MSLLSNFFLAAARWPLFFSLALLPAVLQAQTFTTSGTTFTGYASPGYVIDSDRTIDAFNGTLFDHTTYKRWYLPVDAIGSVSGGNAGDSRTMRMAFNLIDTTTGDPVDLQDVASETTVTTLYSAVQTVSGNTSASFPANLVVDPSVQLDQNRTYRPRAQLQQRDLIYFNGNFFFVWINVGTPHDAVFARSFVHFKGPWGSDSALNVVARANSHSFTRRYALRNVPAQENFATTVNYSLYRYDEPHTGSSATDPITVRLTAALFDSTDPLTPLALDTSIFTDVPALARTLLSGIRVPATISRNFVVNFRPTAPLDPVNKSYFVRVTIAHVEMPFPLSYVTSNARTTGSGRFLDLSGNLNFGSLQTTLTGVSSVGVPGTISGGMNLSTLTGAQGILDGTSHTFGPGSLNVSVAPDGDAFCNAPSTITLNPPATPDKGSSAGVSFERATITLSSSGASASSLDVILPAGFGIGFSPETKRLDGRVNVPGPIALTQQLLPAFNQTVNFGSTRYAVEETKPVAMAVTQINWDVGGGLFIAIPAAGGPAWYVREQEMLALDAAPLPAADKLKRSNELYYRAVKTVESQIEVRAGFKAGAEMSTSFALSVAASPVVENHFPWGTKYELKEGRISVKHDRIDPSTSHLDLDNPFVTVPWTSECLDPSCNPLGAGFDAVTVEVPADSFGRFRLGLTADGGLFGDVLIPAGLDLEWGFIPSLNDFAHRVDAPFVEGRLAIAGHFLHGNDGLGGSAGQLFGAATILLSGVDKTGELTERPQLTFTAATPYQQGFGDYPGLNLRLGPPDSNGSGIDGVSRLGGEIYGPYELKNRSKYYVRASGVTGIHDKVPTSPESVPIYGYDITLTNFGLAFLSNNNVDSLTSGSIYLPYPSDMELAFDKLSFHCPGGLDKMEISPGSATQTLSYWTAPIDIHVMQFVMPDSCAVEPGFLALGVSAYSSHVKETLSGTFGVFNHGNLIPKSFSDTVGGNVAGLDSRLKMPTKTTIRGPKRQTTVGGDEEYILTPVADAYLDNPGDPGNDFQISQAQHPIGDGFINLAGLLKVSFFQAMPVHIQTSSNQPPGPGDPPGSWGTAVINVANGSWQISGSPSSYFDASYHDTWNRGFPYPSGGGGSNENLNTYQTSTAYYPFVEQTWLGGAIALKYKVKWNSTTRSFRSLDASDSVDSGDGYSAADTQNFVIIQVEHRLTYLSAERAELTFGAEYDGLPTINLTNFVVNQLDEVTGVFKAATDAGLDLVFDELKGAIDDLARSLNDNLRDFYETVLDPPVNLFVDGVYTHLHTQWNQVGSTWQSAGTVPDLSVQFNTVLQNQVLNQLDPSVGVAVGQLAELISILEVVEGALETIRDDFLATDPSTQQLLAIKTLTRELIKVLSAEIGGSLGSILSASGVDQKLSDLIDPLLTEVKPTVAQIHSVISDLTDVVSQVRGTLDGVVSFDFQAHLQSIFDDANGELATVKSEIETYVEGKLAIYGPASNFMARDPEEVREMMRNAIYDWLIDTVMVEQTQVAIKQRLQDVEHSIRQGLDSAFAQVNTLVKDAISGFLSEIDESINGALGEVSDKIGSGSLQGYAIFNGDALRKVRIDGKFELSIPTETSLKAYLEINQYTSADQPPGCVVLGPGEAYTEVEIGALDVGCDFISPDLRVNVAAKFTMMSDGAAWGLRPTGMGGSFAMASGEISFEAFKITELACGMMFGTTENYITAALGMQFGSYGAKGGVFFGRTCTLDPIMLWDPLVASALGEPNPSFTGAYVYGEAHIPVSEVILGIPASCMFKVTADVGAGFFFFIEGPTYGARLGLGVGGEVLCLVSISGRVDMVGARVGSVTKLKGKGSVSGEIGPCSFCIKFSKSVEMETEIGSDGNMAGKGGTM